MKTSLANAKPRGKQLRPIREKVELYLEKNPDAKVRELQTLAPEVASGTLQTWKRRFLLKRSGLTTIGKPRKQKRKPKPLPEITLEMAMDILIQAMQALRELPKVKAERDKYKRGYNNALDALDEMKKDQKKRRALGNQFHLAQQQDEIKPDE